MRIGWAVLERTTNAPTDMKSRARAHCRCSVGKAVPSPLPQTHFPLTACTHPVLRTLQVVKCWTEAMQLMKEGDKWELTCPSELAYGESKRGKYITPGAVLIFEIEIIKVKEVAWYDFFLQPQVSVSPHALQGSVSQEVFFVAHAAAHKRKCTEAA